MLSLRTALPVPLLLALAACAADAAPETDASDAVGRDAAPEVTEDTDAATPDVEPDAEPQDTTPDLPDVADTAPDVSEPDTFDCEEVGEECEPRSVYCTDQTTRAFCSRCGFIVSDEACAEGQVCDDSTGVAACRPCVGEECPDIIQCEPRSLTCANFQTVQVCGADGRVESTQPCPAGRRCFDGQCGPAGQDTGSACTADIDPAAGCVGQTCVCGPGWQATNGAAGCGAPLAVGYCSTSDCAANGCNFGTEVCLDVPGNPFGGTSICVEQNSCTTRGRPCGSGFVCEELPARTGPGTARSWEMGCWVNTQKPLGGACTSDADCLGGDCRTRNVAGANVNYCASPCGADGGCPSYASCVEDPERAGDFVCLANGDGADCPRINTEPRWIQDRALPRFGGGQARVCYFPRSSD